MDTLFFKKTESLFIISLNQRDDGAKKKQVLEKTAAMACLQG